MFSSSLFTFLQSVYQAVVAQGASESSFTTDWVSVPVPRKSSLSGGEESGVRAPMEVHRTSRQLYERRSGRRFPFKRRVIVIILSHDFTSCGRRPSGRACFVLSQEPLHLFTLKTVSRLHLLMCTPIMGVTMAGRASSLCRCYLTPVI